MKQLGRSIRRALCVLAAFALGLLGLASPLSGQEKQAQPDQGQQALLGVPAATARNVGEQLARGFKQESPFTPDAPDHLWLDNGDGTYEFLHFDKPLAEATKVIFIGYGVKGRWCAEDQPQGFTHFHRTAKVAAWDAGHGGSKPGEEGYWLKHVAVERFEMPEMMGMPARTIEPGLDRMFMPTKPPKCGKTT